MGKYINADEFEYVILHADIEVQDSKCKDYESYVNGAEQFRYQIKNAINKAPAAEVEEVKRGNWDECEEGLFYSCSACGYLVEYQLSNYCPNCGAEMTGQRRKDIIPECEHCHDEICVNDQCPMCADYCPVPDIPEVCKYEERGRKETEKKQKKES